MRQKLPNFLKRPILETENTRTVRRILKANNLNTVCENARCPNKNECYKKNTATFLIMGNVCTRNCLYCNISCQKPSSLDINEPENVARAIRDLGLKYAVITSVTRDDLPDGGASHFVQCIEQIRKYTPDVKIEILTPDFKNNKSCLDIIIGSKPDVFNHNIETVREIFKTARPQGNYDNSLEVIKYVAKNSDIKTKSGLMIGLGETLVQIENTMKDLVSSGCDILTIGQYIQPAKQYLPVIKYYNPEEYDYLYKMAKDIGFKAVQASPLVRSSYNAYELESQS